MSSASWANRKSAKLGKVVDFLVRIDGNDRIIEDMQLVSDAKEVTTSGKVRKL